MLKQRKRVGIVGLGDVARAHWYAYSKMDQVHIVAGADPDRQARSRFEAQGIKTFNTLDAMIAEASVDIVCVCSAVSTHESVARKAAGAGVHVLCEKPLSDNSISAKRIVDACATAGVKLQYGSSHRFLPAVTRARELLKEGRIGDVLQIKEEMIGGSGISGYSSMDFSHYPQNGPGGGPWGLVDHGIHMMDVFPWLIDGKITAAYGAGNRSGQVPKAEFAILELNDGQVTGHLIYNELTFSTTLPHEGIFGVGKGWGNEGLYAEGYWQSDPVSIEVYGSRGSIRIFGYPNALFLANREGVVRIPTEPAASPIQFTRQMEAFIRAIDEDLEPEVPGKIGVRALEVLEAVYRSAETGKKVLLS